MDRVCVGPAVALAALAMECDQLPAMLKGVAPSVRFFSRLAVFFSFGVSVACFRTSLLDR
jgi:hypothetical protein